MRGNKEFICFLAYWPDFNKVPDNVTSTFGLPYDYTSVMHYPRYAFSKNGKETIVAKVSYNTRINTKYFLGITLVLTEGQSIRM